MEVGVGEGDKEKTEISDDQKQQESDEKSAEIATTNGEVEAEKGESMEVVENLEEGGEKE